MSECIFCQIIHKRAPASIVYEDEQVVAFLSNGPVNPGHTLVVPKKHHANIYEASEEEVAYLFRITKKMAQAVKEATAFREYELFRIMARTLARLFFICMCMLYR